MRSMGFSKEKCIRALREFREAIQKILALLDDQSRIGRENIDLARQLLSRLKGDLRNEYKKRATSKGEEAMSKVERAFYFPAIHEAYTSIHVATNSLPTRKWLEELYDAQSTIEYYHDQLQRNEG